jgi:glycine hydroxymethyltransferase
MHENLKNKDKEVYAILEKEEERKEKTLEMIPSENHTSLAVLEALSSVFNDKYAEGYPKKRYYGGNKHIDEVEILCQERAKEIFGVPFANVQSYSGSPANMAVYFATLEPGEKVLGMHLNAGGHLTHGWKVNFSGKYYDSYFYGVNKENSLIDYDEVERIAKEVKPKLIFAGTTSYPRFLDFKRFREIADSVGAYLCADISHIAGLVVAGAHPSPVDYAHIVTTTTHKTLRGPRGALVMVTQSGLEKDTDLPEKINRAVFPGLQGGPHEHQIAAIAVCLKEAKEESFKEYGKQVVKNAQKLAEELKKRGFNVVSGGTDNHLLVLDLQNKNILGKEAQELLEKAGIIVNKNAIPFDPNPPAKPSGIRLGTPAITTRGMKESEVEQIADFISEVIEKRNTEEVKKKVEELCLKFSTKK